MFLINGLICTTFKELGPHLLRVNAFMMDVITGANSTVHFNSQVGKGSSSQNLDTLLSYITGIISLF